MKNFLSALIIILFCFATTGEANTHSILKGIPISSFKKNDLSKKYTAYNLASNFSKKKISYPKHKKGKAIGGVTIYLSNHSDFKEAFVLKKAILIYNINYSSLLYFCNGKRGPPVFSFL